MTLQLAIRVKADADQVKPAADAAGAALESIGVKAAAAETRAKGLAAGMGDLQDQVSGLRAKYVPLFAIERQHEAALVEIAAAQRQGILSADEASAAIARQTASFAQQRAMVTGAGAAMRGFAATGKLTGQEMTLFSYQINDAVVSILGGMNPLIVLLQQGSQITPMFGGIAGTFSAAATGAQRLGAYLTTLRGAMAGLGVGVAVGTIVALIDHFQEAERAAKAYEARQDKVQAGLRDLAVEAGKLSDALGKLSPVEQEAFGIRQLEAQQASLENIKQRAGEVGDAIADAFADSRMERTASGWWDLYDVLEELTLQGERLAGIGLGGQMNDIIAQFKSLGAARDAEGMRALIDTWGAVIDTVPGLRAKLIQLTADVARGSREADELAARWRRANAALLEADPTARVVRAAIEGIRGSWRDLLGDIERATDPIIGRAMSRLEELANRAGLWWRRNAPAEGNLNQYELSERKSEVQYGQGMPSRTATPAVDDFLRGLREEADLIRLDEDAHRALSIQLDAERAARDEGRELTVRERAEIDQLTLAIETEGRARERRRDTTDIMQRQEESIAAARAELAIIGQSTAERERAIAVMEAERDIRRANIATGSAEAEQIRQNAVTMADLSIEIDRQRTLYDDFGAAGRDAIDSVNEALARGELSWDSLESVATSAIASITKSLLNFGTQPLTSGLQGMIGAAAASLGIGSTQSIAAYDVATNPIFHDGGMVGGPSRSSRTVAAVHWDRAPRYHAGGILPGEQAVIAKNGEGIFTPRQMDNANQLFSALAQQQQSSPVNVTVVNNAGVEVRTKQRKNSQGGMDLAFELDRAQAGNAMNPASAFSRSLSEGWGAQPPVYARGA